MSTERRSDDRPSKLTEKSPVRGPFHDDRRTVLQEKYTPLPGTLHATTLQYSTVQQATKEKQGTIEPKSPAETNRNGQLPTNCTRLHSTAMHCNIPQYTVIQYTNVLYVLLLRCERSTRLRTKIRRGFLALRASKVQYTVQITVAKRMR